MSAFAHRRPLSVCRYACILGASVCLRGHNGTAADAGAGPARSCYVRVCVCMHRGISDPDDDLGPPHCTAYSAGVYHSHRYVAVAVSETVVLNGVQG